MVRGGALANVTQSQLWQELCFYLLERKIEYRIKLRLWDKCTKSLCIYPSPVRCPTYLPPPTLLVNKNGILAAGIHFSFWGNIYLTHREGGELPDWSRKHCPHSNTFLHTGFLPTPLSFLYWIHNLQCDINYLLKSWNQQIDVIPYKNHKQKLNEMPIYFELFCAKTIGGKEPIIVP